MLFTGEDLSNFFCRSIKIGKTKVTILNCTYPSGHDLDATLYEGKLGLVLTIFFMLFHIAFYYLNLFVGKDFVKCFATATVVPLTAGIISLFIQLILTIILDPTYWIVEVFNHLYAVCQTTAFFTAHLGLAIFIFAHAFIMCTGKAPDMEDSWSIYFTVQLLGWILSGCAHFTANNYKRLPAFALVSVMGNGVSLVVIGVISSIFSIIFCGNRKHKSEDPVVKNALIRLIFAAGILAWLIPTCLALSMLKYDTAVVGESGDEFVLMGVELFYSQRLLEFFASPFMILVLLTLPTYREALINSIVMRGRASKWAQKTGRAPGDLPLITERQQIYPTQPSPIVMENIKTV